MTRTIMVIDDDADALEVLRRLLRLHGYAVQTASDGQAALDLLAGGVTPSLVVLDLNMPIVNGREFLERRGAAAPPPVVVMSGAEDVVDQLRGMAVDAIVRKPVRPTALVKVIEDLLARAPAAPRLAAGSGPTPADADPADREPGE
jgi:DNA-binding response OmpR family regulator